MPIGFTPGHLSRGINLHATKALRWSGLTWVVHRRFPTHARAVQRSLEHLKELQSLLQEWTSRPDRPAVPLFLRAAFRMALPFRFSKRIGFIGIGEPYPAVKCLLKQVFSRGWMVCGELVREESEITSSRLRTPPEELEDSNLSALFIFPRDIRFWKDLARATLSRHLPDFGKCSWIHLPYNRISFILPAFHNSILLFSCLQ